MRVSGWWVGGGVGCVRVWAGGGKTADQVVVVIDRSALTSEP